MGSTVGSIVGEQVGKPKERDHLRDLAIDRRMMLKSIIQKGLGGPRLN
jgi:hypothetical protein